MDVTVHSILQRPSLDSPPSPPSDSTSYFPGCFLCEPHSPLFNCPRHNSPSPFVLRPRTPLTPVARLHTRQMQPRNPLEGALVDAATLALRVYIMATANIANEINASSVSDGDAPPPLIAADATHVGEEAAPPPPKRFYSVTVGKVVGVFDLAFHARSEEAQDSVKNIPGSALRKFPTQREAAKHFNEQIALGRVRRVIVDEAPVDDATDVPTAVVTGTRTVRVELVNPGLITAATTATPAGVSTTDPPVAVATGTQTSQDDSPLVIAAGLPAPQDEPSGIVTPTTPTTQQHMDELAAESSPAEIAAYIEFRRVNGRVAAEQRFPATALHVAKIRLDAIETARTQQAQAVASGSSRLLTPPPPSETASIHGSDIPDDVDIRDDVSDGTYGGDPEHLAMIQARRREAEENRRITDEIEFHELVEEAQTSNEN
ncbi:hypothetical protein SCHPADRAFT_896738 [Schizopora paradoxa]|uniref:Ribonuclease H1 N-terminal domain-containing protein n=1 Tax=Schizopora paradoxa TaxID=27342 RepID=A0A0H2R5S3_9AGAM|nr:hypothetical protein SCHPADRAFT_896738 [Schizopora paradoxa]